MAVAVIMPRQGNTVESCIITEWKKKPGDSVAVGDILFAYETDKAAFECEAETAGTLLKIMFEEGDDVPVLENVCVGINGAMTEPKRNVMLKTSANGQICGVETDGSPVSVSADIVASLVKDGIIVKM